MPSQIYATLPLNLPPRGLSRAVAAAYIGVSTHKFDDMVADGRMPAPKIMDARRVWDRLALDKAFDALPDGGQADDSDPRSRMRA